MKGTATPATPVRRAESELRGEAAPRTHCNMVCSQRGGSASCESCATAEDVHRGMDVEALVEARGLELRTEDDDDERCECPQGSHSRSSSHLRQWPRDRGGGCAVRAGSASQPRAWPRAQVSHKDAYRDIGAPWSWQCVAVLQVLLLMGRVLPASGTAAAPNQATGLPSSSATMPPLSQPQLPVSSYRTISSTPPLQSLVTQMMDKLDKLDRTLTEMHWEIRFRVDNVERRLGDMDGKVERRVGDLDVSLGRRLDKLVEAVASHDLKDSNAKEQLGRKVDGVHDRIVYMENNSINKLQQTVDKTLAASSNVQRAVDQAVGKTRDELSARVTSLHAQMNATHDHVLNVSRTAMATPLDDGDESEAGQRACVDASDTATKTIKQHIDTKTELMSSKVSKLYNDMWRRVNELESTVKTVISMSNATRRDVQALNVAAMGAQHGRGYNPRQPAQESGLEYALNLHHDAVNRQLSGLRDTLVDELRHVQVLQDTFLTTCNRLNDKDLDVEDKLGRVLTHHTTYLLEHRGVLNELKRSLKTHSTLTGRAAANASESTKRVESAVRGLAEQSRLESKKVEYALARLHNMTAAAQNATEKVASSCGLGLSPLDEEAAWSALLQHNESVVEPTERQEEQTSSTVQPPGQPQEAESARGGAPVLATTPVSTERRELVLVDSNGLQRPPRRDAAGGPGGPGGPGGSQHVDSGQGSHGDGLHGQASVLGQPATPATARRDAVGHDGASSVDSGQDSVTDLSSVDDEDYTEENDDATYFVD